MSVEEIEKYIKSHYLLYKRDIKVIIDKIISSKNIENRKQLKYIICFLESLFYLIDFEIMDNKIINVLNRDIEYIPAPNASRVLLVNNLLDYRLIDFNYVISNNSFNKIKI